jgi:hypothetical protein
MPTHTGPNTAADNSIVFSYDVGDLKNSYRGEPTTNYISDADTMSSWTSYYRTLASSTFTTEFGTTGYRFVKQPSWNGVYKIFNLPSTGTYTFSAWFKYNEGSANNNGATVYIYNYGGGDTAATLNKSLVGVWQRVSHTINVTSLTNVHMFLISYGGVDSGTINPDYSSWEVTMPQVELNSHPTQFVNGTRSVTQGLLPLIGNATIDLSNVSFDSSAKKTFDGTNDYVPITLNTSIVVYCLEMVWYNNNAIPNNDTVIGGPTTYQTPIEFNGDRTGVHLGAWTGGMTNEAIHIWGGGGATSNRVAAAVGYHHIVFNWNGITYDIWVDGVNTTTYYQNGTTPAGLITATSIKLGRDVDNYCFNGQIPITKIYNRALSAVEVKQNYQQYKSRFNLS